MTSAYITEASVTLDSNTLDRLRQARRQHVGGGGLPISSPTPTRALLDPFVLSGKTYLTISKDWDRTFKLTFHL